MKNLLVLWDPKNPLVPAASVVEALRADSTLQVLALSFEEVGHPTLPNGAFTLRTACPDLAPDGILWIEGGPFPSDLEHYRCPKACWLTSTHLEPTLLPDLGTRFDVVFSASIADSVQEKARWLPLAADERNPLSPPPGISLLVDDPMPPLHAEVEQAVLSAIEDVPSAVPPIVVALGNGGRVHPMLFDCLQSGAAVVVDPGCDLRGIAHVGEHLDVYPSREGLVGYLRELAQDGDRLSRLAARGPAIVSHLHESGLRAQEICHGLWPRHRVLSGREARPRVSILVTCYRYLRRLKICLESLARQDLPSGSIEVVVADPQSPDGLARYLEEFARKYPGLRVVHLPMDERYRRNRGAGINRAFDVSLGEIVIGIDGDLVFPPKLVGTLGDLVRRDPRGVYGVRRSFVGKEETERILRGDLDPLADFERLSRSEGDGEEKAFVGVLGYCQAVHRSAFARARYPEEFDMVNQSDIVFLERLAKEADVSPRFLGDLRVLHLWHPRNWMGTGEFL